MQSLESILAESIGEMDAAQRAEFFKNRKSGMPMEAQIALAKETAALALSGRAIRRNNGGSFVQEGRRDVFAETDRVLFEGMAKCRPQTAKGLSDVVEANGQFHGRAGSVDVRELSESQRGDLEFCLSIGMSREEALKVAKSNFIREN